jgi:hypothetical protein
MMHRRSDRTSLPTPRAPRLGRRCTLRRDNIGPMPHRNDDYTAEAATPMIAQHAAERVSRRGLVALPASGSESGVGAESRDFRCKLALGL